MRSAIGQGVIAGLDVVVVVSELVVVSVDVVVVAAVVVEPPDTGSVMVGTLPVVPPPFSVDCPFSEVVVVVVAVPAVVAVVAVAAVVAVVVVVLEVDVVTAPVAGAVVVVVVDPDDAVVAPVCPEEAVVVAVVVPVPFPFPPATVVAVVVMADVVLEELLDDDELTISTRTGITIVLFASKPALGNGTSCVNLNVGCEVGRFSVGLSAVISPRFDTVKSTWRINPSSMRSRSRVIGLMTTTGAGTRVSNEACEWSCYYYY